MTSPLLLQAAWTLAVWALEATALLLAAWLITAALRKSAAFRHMVWLTAFSALLLIPVFSAILPGRLHLPAPAPAAVNTPQAPQPYVLVEDAATAPAVMSKVQPFPATLLSEGPAAPAVPEKRDWTPALLCLFAVWLAGVAMVALQGVGALVGIRRMYRRSTAGPLDGPALDRLAARVGLMRPWDLRISTTTEPPAAMTWGCRRPVVLLPRDADTWPGERLETVLLHELAHVRRRDSLCQLLSLAACAFYWFHPLVWLSARALKADAESAADDVVLLSGIKPSAYATELLWFAAHVGRRRQPFAQIGVSIMKHPKIASRIESIVDPFQGRRTATRNEVWKAVAAGAAAVLLLASARPAVSMDDREQTPAPPAPAARVVVPAPTATPEPAVAQRPTRARRVAARRGARARLVPQQPGVPVAPAADLRPAVPATPTTPPLAARAPRAAAGADTVSVPLAPARAGRNARRLRPRAGGPATDIAPVQGSPLGVPVPAPTTNVAPAAAPVQPTPRLAPSQGDVVPQGVRIRPGRAGSRSGSRNAPVQPTRGADTTPVDVSPAPSAVPTAPAPSPDVVPAQITTPAPDVPPTARARRRPSRAPSAVVVSPVPQGAPTAAPGLGIPSRAGAPTQPALTPAVPARGSAPARATTRRKGAPLPSASVPTAPRLVPSRNVPAPTAGGRATDIRDSIWE